MPKYRPSLYADDIMMFIKPCCEDTAARRLMDAVGEASGLHPNFAKSLLSLIRCDGIDLRDMIQQLWCPMSSLPRTYLGLALAVSRLTRAELQPVIDKVLKPKQDGKLEQNFVRCRSANASGVYHPFILSMPIFQILTVHPPVWFLRKICKAGRGFLWENNDVAVGGKCLVNSRQDRALFEASVLITIDDGEATQFWKDPWRPEGKLCVVFYYIFKTCTLRKITIRKAIVRDKCIKHLMPDMPPEAIRQFGCLWNMLRKVQLIQGIGDRLTWKWTADGAYSASFGIRDSIRPSFPSIVWGSDAPPSTDSMLGWRKCLAADVLARKGCPRDLICPLCRTQPETAAHLLASCPYAQSVWALVIDRARLPVPLLPGADTKTYMTC
ncbi:hypothetical protein ACQ4PT_016138 [Festuca glaucescens]